MAQNSCFQRLLSEGQYKRFTELENLIPTHKCAARSVWEKNLRALNIANNKVIESFSQEIPKDVILIRNRQLKGNYDLSDFFTIKPAYKKMIIKDPTKEEIEQQLKSNLIENLIKKEKNGELKKAIENDDVAQIPVSFRDNVSIRPWVQRIIDKGKN